MLFSEVYGTYYNVLAQLLRKAVDGELTRESMLETVRDRLADLAQTAQVSRTLLEPVARTVGLSIVTRLSAALCRDAGEGSIAAALELAGGAAAVVVALPLLDQVLSLVGGLL